MDIDQELLGEQFKDLENEVKRLADIRENEQVDRLEDDVIELIRERDELIKERDELIKKIRSFNKAMCQIREITRVQ